MTQDLKSVTGSNNKSANLNCTIPTRSIAEYQEVNKDKIKENQELYYEMNKDKKRGSEKMVK